MITLISFEEEFLLDYIFERVPFSSIRARDFQVFCRELEKDITSHYYENTEFKYVNFEPYGWGEDKARYVYVPEPVYRLYKFADSNKGSELHLNGYDESYGQIPRKSLKECFEKVFVGSRFDNNLRF